MQPSVGLFKGANQPEFRRFLLDAGVSVDELYRGPFYRMRRFTPAGKVAAPVLVVPPLSGHFPVLVRDMVLDLLKASPVVLIDWANVRHVPQSAGTFGMEDNIAAIRLAILHTGPEVSVIALCQSGIPSLAAVADIAATNPVASPAALTLIAAPVDPLVNPTPVGRLIRGRSRYWYEIVPIETVPRGTAGQGRWVYPAKVQLAALELYLERHMQDGGELAHKLARDDGADPVRFPFIDLYTSTMDLDARQFAENIDTVFLRRLLPRGALFFEDRCIDPGAIRQTEVASVEGGQDDIAAPGQTAAVHDLCSGLPARAQHRLVVPGAGHFSLFHGDIWRRVVLPFLQQRGVVPAPRGAQPQVCGAD